MYREPLFIFGDDQLRLLIVFMVNHCDLVPTKPHNLKTQNNVKGVICSDEPTKNYDLNPQLPSALPSVTAILSGPQLYCFGSLSLIS